MVIYANIMRDKRSPWHASERSDAYRKNRTYWERIPEPEPASNVLTPRSFLHIEFAFGTRLPVLALGKCPRHLV